MGTTSPTLASVAGKRIVMVSHDLSQSGSPLLLVETAVKLRQAGANVELVTLAEDAHPNNLAARNNIKVLANADSFEHSAQADLVIANTAETSSWVNSYLRKYPYGGRSLIWWIHEIDARYYAGQMHSLPQVAISLFDSYASLRNWTDTDLRFPASKRVIHPCVNDALIEKAGKFHFSRSWSGLLKRLTTRKAAYTRTAIRKKLHLKSDDFVLTLIGTYQSQPRKGHDLFISTVSRLLREHPLLPIKAIVVGFSEEEKIKFVKGLNEAGRKALDISRVVEVVQDLAPYYAASDAFVMNSQGFGENFGRVTIEAMTFRLPVLGTNGGGTPEIIEDGATGLLHPLGVDGQYCLGENILTLMKNRERAKAMGEAGYIRVLEKFTGSQFYAEFGSLLETILSGEQR